MTLPEPGDFVVMTCAGVCQLDGGAPAQSFHDGDTPDGDIKIRGWLTTEKINSYRQIVKAETFDWSGGTSRWNGRVLDQHGRRFLLGGGSDLPVGQILRYEFVKGKGLWGSGHIWAEAPERLKRAIRDKVTNAFSIGFIPEEDGLDYDKKEKLLTISKGVLLEVSTVNVGANDESLFEVFHQAAFAKPDRTTEHKPRDHFYLIHKGRRYLVTEGRIYDAG